MSEPPVQGGVSPDVSVPLSDLSCPVALCVVTDPVGGAELSFKPRVDDAVPL